jgi:hypothetical protein
LHKQNTNLIFLIDLTRNGYLLSRG